MLSSEIKVAFRFTVLTMVLLGIGYPLVVTAFAHVFLRSPADGGLIVLHGQLIGSRLIGQSFTDDKYFHGRPSAAGNGYDGTSSSGSNFAASNQALISRTNADVARYEAESPGAPVPIDLVTASGSGLDPDISPAAAKFQVPRVAKVRHLPVTVVQELVERHIERRQFGVLGENRVNVLLLNLDLDGLAVGVP